MAGSRPVGVDDRGEGRRRDGLGLSLGHRVDLHVIDDQCTRVRRAGWRRTRAGLGSRPQRWHCPTASTSAPTNRDRRTSLPAASPWPVDVVRQSSPRRCTMRATIRGPSVSHTTYTPAEADRLIRWPPRVRTRSGDGGAIPAREVHEHDQPRGIGPPPTLYEFLDLAEDEVDVLLALTGGQHPRAGRRHDGADVRGPAQSQSQDDGPTSRSAMATTVTSAGASTRRPRRGPPGRLLGLGVRRSPDVRSRRARRRGDRWPRSTTSIWAASRLAARGRLRCRPRSGRWHRTGGHPGAASETRVHPWSGAIAPRYAGPRSTRSRWAKGSGPRPPAQTGRRIPPIR